MATYSIISASQLETIRSKVAPKTEDSAQEERRRLKELSDERASQWPNTLEAQRARKERARIERMAAEEAERVETDKQEAQLKAEQRRVQIERANKILFDDSDKVKGFHSKMLLCDVMQENAELIEYKKQIEVLKRAQEQAFVEQQSQQMETATQAELAKMAETRRKALAQREVQMQQLEDLKRRILSARAENKREGEVLRQKALEEIEEMKQKELARFARAKQNNADTKKANETLQAFRAKEVERAKEQEIAIEAYSRKKAEMIAERERREAEKRAIKDLERKRIADNIEQAYLAFTSKEEGRVAREVAEAEVKATADEAARRQRIKDTQAAIDRSRQAQLKAKAETKTRDKEEDLAFVRAWEQRTRELKQEEVAEKRERFERNRGVADFQLRQAAIKARRMADAKISALQDAAQLALSLQEQDDIYQRYAKECIDEYRMQGKPTMPMELHLRKKESLDTIR